MKVEPGGPPLVKPRWSLHDGAGLEVAGGVWIAPPADMNIYLRLAPGTYVFACEDDQGRRAGGGVEVIEPPELAKRTPPQEYAFPLR